MTRSRVFGLVLGLVATLMFAVLVVPGLSHDEDEKDPARPSARDGNGNGHDNGHKAVALPGNLIGLEFELQADNQEPWTGEVKVSEGQVLEVDVLRAGANAQVEGARFNARAAAAKAKAKAKQNAAKKKKNAVAKKKAQQNPANPLVLATLDAPGSARVTLSTNRGDVTLSPADLDLGESRKYLDGKVTVTRGLGALRLTGPKTEDDHPVLAPDGDDGKGWLVYTEYTPDRPHLTEAPDPADFDKILVPKGNGDRIRLRRFDGKQFSAPLDVTAGGQDVWRPSAAVDGKGAVWVVWGQKADDDWEVHYRTYTPGKDGDGTWSDASRLTRAKGSDFAAVATADADGHVWVAWQAFRDDNYDILAADLSAGRPEPRRVSDSPRDDWSPAIAAGPKGGVYVAWDTYDKGNFDVRLRRIDREGSDAIDVANSPRFEARAALACDREGRVWVAFEEGNEQWGKDYANATPEKVPVQQGGFPLYLDRTVRVKCLADGGLKVPRGDTDKAFGDVGRRGGKSVPRLAIDGRGGVWVLVRHHPLSSGQGEAWISSAIRYDGAEWSPPARLGHSANLMDNRPALLPHDGGLLAVYSSDDRAATANRDQDDLFVAVVRRGGDAQAPQLTDAGPSPGASLKDVHPNERDDIARLRAHRVEAGGKTLHLMRGEFHRHTEFSSHGDQDGLLEDTWRYAYDAADHDWMGNGDHDNGAGWEYMWWLIQKMTDVHHNPPRFVAAMTYERSVVYPNGHRNVIMPKRGIRPLPRGELPGTEEEGTPDTKLLYKYLKHFGGMCASHTSGTNMGTDWRDNDPEVEPVVEIYQGHRHNYEHFGAPRSPTEETQIGGYQPKGFIWNALEKGYKLGFESSSDHVSTHFSYAILLTEDTSRQGIIDAFKKRHSYAATDNILLEVRSGDHLMGDVFETDAPPTLRISALGTADIAKVHVIRDNKYVFTHEPGARRVMVNFTDDDARPGDSHYYYVRIEQADTSLAWASPMWITYKAK